MRIKIKAIWERLVFAVFRARMERYIDWCLYEMGMTGHGTTKLDTAPMFDKPQWVPQRKQLDAAANALARERRDIWHATIMETLGEDPNDWH